MPEELIKAIYTLTKALERFPKGAVGSSPASSAAELIWKKQDLENIKEQSASYENRSARIEFETLFTQIQTVINKSNRLYAFDKAREESPGRYANEASYRRIMELQSQFATKYDSYQEKYQENAEEILGKEFEDALNTARNAIINPLKNIEKSYIAQFGETKGKKMSDDLLRVKANRYIMATLQPEKYERMLKREQWGSETDRVIKAENERKKRDERQSELERLATEGKNAARYIMSLLEPEKYADMVHKEKWGSKSEEVKRAEETKAIRDSIKITREKAELEKKQNEELKKRANLYILSKTNPEKYRDVVGREQWGEHWDRVKAAEDASERERSFGIRGFGVLGKFGGAVGSAIAAVEAFTAGIKTSQHVISSLNEVFIGASRWGLQMKNLADVFNVSPQIAQAYISTGMTSEQANKAAGNMDIWLAGLGFNKGWERIQAMAMAGFDVSAIDWANATPEKVLKILAPQVKGADHRKLATALALGAFSAEDILMMKDYGKDFKDLDRQEQVAQAKEAWRYKLEKLKISDDPKERAIAAGLEKYGDYGYLETEYGGGREKAYKAWLGRDPISLKILKKLSPPDAIWTREEGEERLIQEMLQGMYEQQSQSLMEIPDSGSTAIGIRGAQGGGESNSNTITVNVGGVDVNVNGNVDDDVANNIGDVVADAIIVNFQSSEVIA